MKFAFETKDRSIHVETLILIVGRAASFLFTFFIPIFLARNLAPAEYGTFKQIFLVFTTLYLILQGGMVQSLYYFIPQDPARRSAWVFQSALFVTAAGGLAAVAVLLGGNGLALYFSNPALGEFIPKLALFTLLMLGSSYLETTLIAQQRMAAGSAAFFLSEIVRGLFIIVPLLIDPSLSSVVSGLIAFAMIRFLATAIFTIRSVITPVAFPLSLFDAGRLKTQLAYALPFGVAVLVDIIQQNLHQYVVGNLFDPATFAIYSVGIMQLPIVDFIYTPATQVLMVRMTPLLKSESGEERLALWHDVTARLALFFFPAAFFFCLIAPDFITLLFTNKYSQSIPLFQLSVLTILPAALLSDGMLRCYAEIRFILVTTVLKSLLTVGLIIVLIKTAGLTGAALTAVITVYFGKLIMLWKIQKRMAVSWRRFLPWANLSGTILLAGGVAAPLALLRHTIVLQPFTALALLTTLYWTIYAALLFSTPLLPSSIRALVWSHLDRLLQTMRGTRNLAKKPA
ncbi:MAG: oligosaccharide flippase family protein [Nitrospirae bacterium]|nr:oligosaccharide flippase family protein [Candidatus Manganitrophaceae bacterium]